VVNLYCASNEGLDLGGVGKAGRGSGSGGGYMGSRSLGGVLSLPKV
jgi:hypothetical protein